MKKLYVGNLAYSMEEATLQSLFEQYGSVASAALIKDRDTGRAKGFGFVEMDNDDEATAAIDALNGTEIEGRKIIVNEARPQERSNKPRRGGFSGGGRSDRNRNY